MYLLNDVPKSLTKCTNNTRIKKLVYAIIISLIFLICSLIITCMNLSEAFSEKAEVYVDGNLYMTIDLRDKIYREYTVETKYGYNVVCVSDGSIYIKSSDCPDKICVKTGAVSKSGKPIICLPHKLEIIITDSEIIDGVT